MPPQPTPGEKHLAFWLEQEAQTPFVYVIQSGDDGPIKVGYAVDVPARIATLQTGNPYLLRLLYVLPGPQPLEWQLHQRLKDCRLVGEWFNGPQVEGFLEFVADLADRMVSAFDGTIPDFRDFETWRYNRRHNEELTIRQVEPTPVDPELAAERLTAAWTKPRRPRRGGNHAIDNLC